MTAPISNDSSAAQPPSRKDGGLVLWVICGVLVFAVISAVTLVVLVRNPPRIPSAVSQPPATAVKATALSRPASPTPGPIERAADSSLTRVQLSDIACPEVKLHRGNVPGPHLGPYLNTLVDCLMQVHEEPFEAAGMSLSRPGLSPASELDDSGCVTSHDEPDDWAGLYCSANTTIYYRTDWSPTLPENHVEVISHEFGHHLQQQSDVLARVSREQHAAQEEPNGAALVQELTRRLELQAECITGVIVGPRGPLAVRASAFDAFLEARASVAPEWAATHGTGRAQTRWFKAGAEATGPGRLAVCNTFTAPASLVD